ncbi:hypothetical protein GC106_2540 [Kibdelosporangium sp. 4NS15]|uniref:Major facilitator superfamily (MFS) profile domain-containing protein n=1 Tax=Kibdelosporangium persicum TaxID=2698649 RepID=A0ABX2EVI9_9PSEU|nr:hypothetical protein [Kibdelosporangium persicum]
MARRGAEAKSLDELGPRYKWIALSNTTLGLLIATINSSIVLIALPDIFKGIGVNPLDAGNTGYLLWMMLGFLVVTAVLVVAFGRLGDIYGRARMYNLGFLIFTVSSVMLAVTWMSGDAAAIWLIAWRIVQGVGGAFLMANSSAILTDAFPAGQRGLALGINGIAAIAGSFLGLVIGGVLAPIAWHLIFLVSVPFGLVGTIWAYLKLHDTGVRQRARMDWGGNITFAIGLVAVLVGITYGIQPYGGHSMGWTNPWVVTALVGGVLVLAWFVSIEKRVPEPAVHPGPVQDQDLHVGQHRQPDGLARPWRAAVRPDHLAAGDLAAATRLLLRGDAVVGRDLHGADDDRVPARRAGLRGAVRPDRRPRPGHRRDGRHGGHVHRADRPAGELRLRRLRGSAAGQRHRHGDVLVTQPRGGDEQPAGQRPGRGCRDERHVPERRHGPVDRHLLQPDHRGPVDEPARRADHRSNRARCARGGRQRDRAAACRSRAVRGVPRVQPGPAAARSGAQPAVARPVRLPDRPEFLPGPDHRTVRRRAAHRLLVRDRRLCGRRRRLVARRVRQAGAGDSRCGAGGHSVGFRDDPR